MKRIVSILLFELCCLLWAGTGWSQQFDDSFPVVGPHSEGRHKADAIDLGRPDSTFCFVDARDSREYSNDAGGRARDVYYKFEVERPMDIVIHNFRSKIQSTKTHLYKIRELQDYEVPEGEMCPEIACSDGMDGNKIDEICSRYVEIMPEFRYGEVHKGLLCMRRLEKGTYYVMSEGDEFYCTDYNGIIVTTIRGFAAEGNHPDYPIAVGAYEQDFDYEDVRDPWDYYEERTGSTSVYYIFTLRHTMDVTISQEWSNPVGGTVYLNSGKTLYQFHEDTLSLQLLPGNYQIKLYCNIFNVPRLRISGRISDFEEPSENLPVGLTKTRNYIYTIRPTLEISTVAETTPEQAIHTVRYFDGFGRPSQVVDRGYSPLQADVVRLQEYDRQGREGRKWLPVVSTGDGGYVDKEKLVAFSHSFYSGDSCTYSFPVYEDSPLNRVKEQYGEGCEWQEKKKSAKIAYRLNAQDDSVLNCFRFRVNELSDTLIIIENCGSYEPGTLHVEHKSDEDGKISCLFTDHAGRTVLQRNLIDENQSSTYCDTYFIYDGNGHLQVVLSPAAVDSMQVIGSYSNASSPCFEWYTYFYRYDHRNRCIARKQPGSAWEYSVYDDADHLILSQDGNLRQRGEWKFSIPDGMGRVVLTGICRNDVTDLSTFLRGVVVKAKYSPDNTDTIFGGYSVHGLALSSPVVQSVFYFDNYTFLGRNGFPSCEYDESKEKEGYGVWYGDSCGVYSHKGLQTGSISFPLQTHIPALYSVSYYDKYRRRIQTHSSHLLKGWDNEYLSYDFAGNLLKRFHVQTALGKAPQSELYAYRYDHAGRLLETRHRLNNGPEVSLSECGYDAIGRLVFEKKHTNDCLLTEYSYNVRSWREKIRGPLFNQTLYYTDGVGTPCYNGNISSMTWETNSSPVRGYKFTYDGLSRMTKAVYGEGNALAQYPNSFNEQVTGYDKVGNILGLLRYGETESGDYGLLDNLHLSYDGNQLLSVYDNATLSASSTGIEFVDRADSLVEYAYDANGNLTKDLNKKVADIQYNVLNLPCRIAFENGNSISYVYDANGTKLRTTHIIGNCTTITDYCGNVVYENGMPKLLLTEIGYITLSDTVYHYFIQDHQGNNRVVVDQNGTVEEVNHYYPFGGVFTHDGDVQPYKYNGKELDTKGGLNLYDYGARYYDPVLGQFMAVDPLVEKYYGWSPYAYCLGNPANLIDPDGKASQYPPGGGTRVYMGFTNWSLEKANRVGAIAQSTNAVGKQVFAGTSLTLSGSVKTVGGGFSLGSVGAKTEVGFGNLSVSTDRTELTTTASLFKGEFSAAVGSATLKTEATVGEAKGVIGGSDEGIGNTGFSASSKIQSGDNTNAGLDIGGNISAGVKVGPVEANFSVNLKAAGKWISGAIQTIAEMFSPEIVIRIEDKR